MADNEARKIYAARAAEYKQLIEQIKQREKNMLGIMGADDHAASYKRLTLVDEMLYLTTMHLAIHRLSVAIVGGKNEEPLNDARKTLYKAIIYLEEAVSDFIDEPYSEYADKVSEIANVPQKQRYYLIRKLGLAIDLVVSAYGGNTKWKWSFVELQARYATVAKNILDLKDSTKTGLDPHSPDYDTTVFHLRLVKRLLQQAADRYREKYEMASYSIEDFRRAIQYLKALYRVHLLLNERGPAEDVKRKVEIWSEKMEKDHKNREKRVPR